MELSPLPVILWLLYFLQSWLAQACVINYISNHHFIGDALSLSCVNYCTECTLKRMTQYGLSACSQDWGSVIGYTCTITSLNTFDSGEYWCEDGCGLISNPVYITVYDLPITTLTMNPQSPVFPGESVTLKCDVQGYDGWTYWWFMKTAQSQWTAVSQPVFDTVNRDTLIIRADVEVNGDEYQCRGQINGRPTKSQYSNSVFLTVHALPTAKLTVESQSPVFTGESVTLMCEIESSNNWRYQWYKGSSKTSVHQSKINTFTISSPADQDQYWCRGDRDYIPTSSQDSNTVSLYVKALPTATLTVESQSPVFTGESVTLKCEIESSSNWRYQWYKGSSNIAVHQSEINTFTISSPADQDQYWCRGESDYRPTSSKDSNTVRLYVKALPTATLTVESQSPVFTGESVTLKCEIESSGNWRYQWYKGSSNTAVHQSEINTYNISSPADQDQYWCRGKKHYRPTSSQDSNTVRLYVKALPTATLTLESQSPVFTGESVTLKCEIESSSNWRYQWYKGSSKTSVHQSEINTFTISSPADQDQFWCRGERDYRPKSSQDSNRVRLSGKALPTATLTVESQSPVFIGESVTLKCEIESSSIWRYQWYKGSSNTAVHQSEINTFNISSPADQDQYWCRGERDYRPTSSHDSNTVRLYVKALPTATLTVESQSPVFTGESVTLKCEIQSFSNWRYQWYKGSSNTAVHQSEINTFNISSPADQNQYWCRGERDYRPTSSQDSNTVHLSVKETSLPVLRVFSSLLVVSVYLLVSIILGLKCYRAHAQTHESQSQNAVTEE
ncbi:basement membrane-specific heparan sulfate proteoglycan core protein-like [Brachyhypopomus gauderio]|uniref:basement membrane-specific heparan sulfate proteoglycan core protein-like n=1 Tax=Brachyhypopomus gauderio TaxID=698409 RepID=UPI004041F6EC